LCYCAHVCMQPIASGVMVGQIELFKYVQNVCYKCEAGHSEQSALSLAFIKHLLHSSKTTRAEPKSAFCVSLIFGFTEM